MEKQPKPLPKTIEDVREQISEYCADLQKKGWEYIRKPALIKEHDKVLRERKTLIDFSEADYSPGDGFF